MKDQVETKLLQRINEVLSKFPAYWDGDTLLKNKVIEDIRGYNETIIQALLEDELIRETYSLNLDKVTIFKWKILSACYDIKTIGRTVIQSTAMRLG